MFIWRLKSLIISLGIVAVLLPACAAEEGAVNERTLDESAGENEGAETRQTATSDFSENTDGYVTTEELNKLKALLLAKDEYLEDLIEQKARALAASDEALRQKIIDLNVKFKVLESISADIEQLKAEVSSLHNQQNTLVSQLTNAENRLLQAIADGDAAVEAELRATVQRLRTEVAGNTAAIAANRELIDDLGAKVRLIDTSVKKALAKFGKRITNVEETLSKHDAKFRDLVIKMRDKISSLSSRIDRLGAEVGSIREEFSQNLAVLKSELKADIASINHLVATTNATNLAKFDELEGRLAKVDAHVERFELFAQTTRASLSSLMQQVSANEANFATHKDQLDEAKRQFFAFVVVEQAARAELTDQVTKLVEQVEQIALATNRALALAEANASAYNRLRSRMNTEITALHKRVTGVEKSFATELNALNKSLTQQITNLKDYATQMSAAVGLDMQEKFSALAVRVAELEHKQSTFAGAMLAPLADIISDYTNLARLLTTDAGSLLDYTVRTMTGIHDLQREFINATEPVLQSKNVNWEGINTSFTTELSACVSVMHANGSVITIGGKEPFLILAESYANMLVTGERSGNQAIDHIFFGKSNPSSDATIASFIVAGIAPAQNELPIDCKKQVDALARETLLGSSQESISLRDALKNWTLMNTIATSTHLSLASLYHYSAAFDETIRHYLEQYLSADQVIAYLLEGSENKLPYYATAAQILVGAAQDRVTLTDLTSELNRLMLVIKRVREIESQVNQQADRISTIQTEIDTLRAMIQDTAQTTDQQIAKLSSSLATSFALIASMAAALGFEEIMQTAIQEAKKIDDDFELDDLTRPAECVSVSHSYLHSLPGESNAWRCDGNTALQGETLSEKEASKCAIHSNRSSTKYTWGNTREGGYGWSFRKDKGVGNGLQLRMYDPQDPTDNARELALAGRSEGPAPSDKESALVFHVTGHTRYAWRMHAKSVKRDNYYEFTKVITAEDSLVQGSHNDWQHTLPFNSAIGHLGACHWDRYITIEPIDKFGHANGTSCTTRIHTFSPLVLDFSGGKEISTINPLKSETLFDLDANGIKERTGWITRGKTGFLVRDLNGNNKADDGSELFGQATQLGITEKRAENGYTALAQFDADNDGYITKQDSIFGSLLVWFDRNENGESELGELRRLSDLHVTSIRVGYSNRANPRDFQGLPEGNLVKFESRFFGPKNCSKSGCKSYDVFFGAQEVKRTASTQ